MKDIEWLKEEVEKTNKKLEKEYKATSSEARSMKLFGFGMVMPIIDQLDEPVLAEIPDYVAEYIEDRKKVAIRLTNVLSASQKKYVETDSWGEFDKWTYHNEELFVRAWIDGYTVKEKKYYVIPPHKDSEGYKMYLTTTDDGELDEEDLWFNTEVEKEHYSDNLFKYEFTKQEIKKINNGIYWPFAKEVTE